MKKLLVFLLCAALLVPTVGMNAQAATQTAETAAQTEADKAGEDARLSINLCYDQLKFSTDEGKEEAGKILEDAAKAFGLEYENGRLEAAPNKKAELTDRKSVENHVKEVKNALKACKDRENERLNDKKSFDEAVEAAIKEINASYAGKDFTEDAKKEADSYMKDTAAKKFGCKFENGKLVRVAGENLEFQNVKGLNSAKDEVLQKLNNFKVNETPPTEPSPEDPKPEEPIMTNSNIIIGGKEYETTIANAGHHCEIAVPLVNLGETDVTNVVITPALSGNVEEWPFAIEKTDYSQVCDELEGEDSGKSVLDRKCTFRWTLKTRDDAITGYTKLVFNVSYNEEDGTQKTVALDYYVQVNGVAPKAEGGKISTPRVIVTGFTTTPEEVYAGDTFKLTLNLKNTSKKTSVSNLLFDIQGTQEGKDQDSTYSAFLPTAGSSTIYVDNIAPNASKSITIEMKSKADLAQKPYVVTVNMEYEDSDANPFTETASVSVPIKQEPKVDVSSITAMPESLEIGNEANVMFSIYNVGKTKLYNVNVKFEADSISGGDTFIGNMDPGATGNVDAYLMGQAATMDDGTVKVLITYENEEGKEEKIEKTLTLFVSEPYYPEDMEGMGMPEEMETEKKGLPWWGIALIATAAVIAAVVVFVVIKKKRRAKLQAQEELEVIDLLEDNQSEEK